MIEFYEFCFLKKVQSFIYNRKNIIINVLYFDSFHCFI